MFSVNAYYSFTFLLYYENGYKIILHSSFSENIFNCNFTLYLQKTVTKFYYESAYYNRLHLVTMQITMKACFHCIGIMLVICQDVSISKNINESAYYISISILLVICQDVSVSKTQMKALTISCKRFQNTNESFL